MAQSPPYKIYSASKEYIGCVKCAEDAAVLVSVQGDGATVRYDHKNVVWTEGSEEIPAGESYDGAASTMQERVKQIHIRAYNRILAKEQLKRP